MREREIDGDGVRFQQQLDMRRLSNEQDMKVELVWRSLFILGRALIPRMQEEENKKDGWIKSKWCKNKDEGARQKLRLLR